MSVKTDLLWIAVRFIAKSVVVGLAIFGGWALAHPQKQQEGVRVRALPDPQHNIVCFVTSTGSIACLNVVLNT